MFKILFICFLLSPKLFAQTKIKPIQFELLDNRIFVDVMVNEKGPFKFIFDTGGSNAMTFDLAGKLGLSVTDAGDGTGAGPDKQHIGQTDVQNFQVGAINLTQQKFLVIDFSKIQKAFNLPALDGIFGYEILTQYLAFIDYDHHELSFFLNGEGFNSAGYASMRFKLQNESPIIKTRINGFKSNTLIDTGDRSALTVTTRLRKHPLVDNFFDNKPEIPTGYGVGGPILAQVTRIPKLRLTAFDHLSDVSARGPLFKGGLNGIKGLDASIGNEILKQFDVAFDYQHKMIYFRQNRHFGEKTHFVPVPNPEIKYLNQQAPQAN